jgi:hypothetical protein
MEPATSKVATGKTVAAGVLATATVVTRIAGFAAVRLAVSERASCCRKVSANVRTVTPTAATATRRLFLRRATSSSWDAVTPTPMVRARKKSAVRLPSSGWRAERNGERASSDTMVASHAIGDRNSDDSLSATSERWSIGKRRSRSLLRLTFRFSPRTTTQSRQITRSDRSIGAV